MKVYVVTAYRWGNKENHSYVVGIYSTEKLAISSGIHEEEYRGGKYNCEVLEYKVEKKEIGKVKRKIIKKLEFYYRGCNLDY